MNRSRPRPPARVRSALAAGALLPWTLACGSGDPEEDAASAAAGGPAVPRFTDVLADSGIDFRHHFLDSETGSNYRINPYDHGSGVAISDVDGDGRPEVYLLDFLGPNALYRNLGGMKFEDVTARARVGVPRALSVGAAFGDFDDDGDADLYVTTYRGGNRLFENRGGFEFEDVTETAGVGYVGHSNAATWFDHDLDGDLDLYLCNIGSFTTETISQEADYFYAGVSLPFTQLAQAPQQHNPGERDVLYRNEGDGTFTDVTEAAGIRSIEWNGDAAVADIDLDGDPDLYTSNMFGANHLFVNRGDGTFEERTDEALRRTSWGGMGARFFDGNGDPYPDLYVVDMHSDMWMPSNDDPSVVEDPKAKYDGPLGPQLPGGKRIEEPSDSLTTDTLFGNTYFENRGDGTFVERSREANLENWWPWGITTGDYNNDGAEDVFVTAGMGYPFWYWPNHLYLNRGDGTFVERAAEAGIEPPAQGEILEGAAIDGREFTRSSRCAASADLDGDGDLDIVVNNFNHEPYLLRNDSGGNALRLRLVGDEAAPEPFGARVVVHAGGRTWHRQLAGAQGYLSQNEPIVHVGLGPAEEVDRVEVHWPGGTEAQVVESPAVGEVVTVRQE